MRKNYIPIVPLDINRLIEEAHNDFYREVVIPTTPFALEEPKYDFPNLDSD